MDEIINCTVVGIASVARGDVGTNPSGRETWIGVRLRTDAGKVRFLKGMLVEAEAALIIRQAMDDGEPVELWLTGKEERAYPYAIRTASETWYHGGYSDYLWGQGVKISVFALLTLPLLGMGLLALPIAFGYLASSYAFAPRHSRQSFEAGRQAGGHASRPSGSAAARAQAA